MGNHAEAAETYLMCIAAKTAAEASLGNAKGSLIEAAEKDLG